MGFRIISIVLIFLVDLAPFSGNIKGEGIEAIYGNQVSLYRGELIWFVDGINERELRYESGPISPSYYVTTDTVDPIIAVRFDSLDVPMFIRSVGSFVSDEDHFPDLPGDQYTPFYLTIYADQSGIPDSELVTPVQVAADDFSGTDNGKWVSGEVDYLLHDRDCFWGAAFWQEGLPSAPCMRYDMVITIGKSRFSILEDGERIWTTFQFGNYRIKADAVANDLDGTRIIASGAIVPDSFRIYSSGQGQVFPDELFYDTTVTSNLHCRVKLPSPQNYFCVTSFVDGIESPPTEIVLIEGSSQRQADVRFNPGDLQIDLPPNSSRSKDLILTNKNGREINYRISEVNFQDGIDASKIGFCFGPSEGTIADDRADTISINISVQDAAYGSYGAGIEFEFWDSIQGYMNEEYPVTLDVGEFTSVEDPDISQPSRFYLGQNYPNPFNSETIIPYGLPEGTHCAEAEILNLLGKRVAVIPLDSDQGGILAWDGKDSKGDALASGIYFLRIKAGKETRICRMILLK